MFARTCLYSFMKRYDKPIGETTFTFVFCTAHRQNKVVINREQNLFSGNYLVVTTLSLCYKRLGMRISSYGCAWEVWRALKNLELLLVMPHALQTSRMHP